MSSGCGIPVSITDEAGNICEIFVDYGITDFCPPAVPDVTPKIVAEVKTQ